MKHLLFTALLTVGLTFPGATAAWAQRGGRSGGGGHAVSGGHATGGGHAMSSGRATSGGSRGFSMPAGPRGGVAPSIGHAVPRGSARLQPYYRQYPGYGGWYSPFSGYYGYGPSFGLGFGYDPFWDDTFWPYGYPAYDPGPYVAPQGAITGTMRIDVTPKTAQVYVDGYYAGTVDDFNGRFFHHLELTAGEHHIEVRAPGYDTLSLETMIQPDHTTDYKGSLTPSAAAGQ